MKFTGRKSKRDAEKWRLKKHPLNAMEEPWQIDQYVDNIHSEHDLKELIKTLAKMVILSQ